jgi:hypothetical protein
MFGPICLCYAACHQVLPRKLPNCLQHPEPRFSVILAVLRCDGLQQTFVHQRGERVEPSPTNHVRRLKGELTVKHGEATEEHLLLGVKQVVAPGQGFLMLAS